MTIQEFRFAFPAQRLGIWECNEDDMLVSVTTAYDFTVHPIKQGVVDSQTHLTNATSGAYALFQRLLKTKHTGAGINLRDCIVPRRTHTFIDLLLDTSAPNTRKAIHFGKDRTYLATCIVLDLLTLLFRCITCLPRIAYNISYPHPLRGEFGKDADSVFVQCKKTVQIIGHLLKKNVIQEPIEIRNGISTIYQWPVNFVNPLNTTFEYREHTLPFEQKKGRPQFIVNKTEMSALERFCKTALSKEKLGIVGDLTRERGGREESLSDLLKNSIATPPTVAFI